jgi:hypothetical protein
MFADFDDELFGDEPTAYRCVGCGRSIERGSLLHAETVPIEGRVPFLIALTYGCDCPGLLRKNYFVYDAEALEALTGSPVPPPLAIDENEIHAFGEALGAVETVKDLLGGS